MIYKLCTLPEDKNDGRFPPLLSAVSKQIREECLPVFFQDLEISSNVWSCYLESPSRAAESFLSSYNRLNLDYKGQMGIRYNRFSPMVADMNRTEHILRGVLKHLKRMVFVVYECSCNETTRFVVTLGNGPITDSPEVTVEARWDPQPDTEYYRAYRDIRSGLKAAFESELARWKQISLHKGEPLRFSQELWDSLAKHVEFYEACIVAEDYKAADYDYPWKAWPTHT